VGRHWDLHEAFFTYNEDKKVLPKRQFSTDPEPLGVRTGSNGDPKEVLKIFVPRTKERVLGDKKWTRIHHRYAGRHVRTRDTERTESVEKSQRRRRHVCVWEGRRVGRDRFSIKARSGVEGGYPARIGLSALGVITV